LATTKTKNTKVLQRRSCNWYIPRNQCCGAGRVFLSSNIPLRYSTLAAIRTNTARQKLINSIQFANLTTNVHDKNKTQDQNDWTTALKCTVCICDQHVWHANIKISDTKASHSVSMQNAGEKGQKLEWKGTHGEYSKMTLKLIN